MSKRLFVYGTLKSGKLNHFILENSKKIDEGYLEGFKMFVSGIPFVWYGNSGDRVWGEVYDVQDSVLRNIDLLEGHPNFYKRTWIPDQLGGVWIYLYPMESSTSYVVREKF